MARFGFGFALGLSCFVASPALAQQSEGEWRVLEREHGAMLVRLFGYETDALPDLAFECLSGKETIVARAFQTFSADGGDPVVDRLRAYAPDARSVAGCDGTCQRIMKRFRAMEGDRPWRPEESAVGTTTFKLVSAGFDTDISGDNYATYGDELPAARRLFRARLAIFKARCGL